MNFFLPDVNAGGGTLMSFAKFSLLVLLHAAFLPKALMSECKVTLTVIKYALGVSSDDITYWLKFCCVFLASGKSSSCSQTLIYIYSLKQAVRED